MTKIFQKIRNSQTDYSTFGGILYLSDFNTSHPTGNIVQRIVSDMSFDRQCRRNSEIRNEKKGCMTND